MVKRYFYFRIYLVGLLLLMLFIGVGARHLYVITTAAPFLLENNDARTQRTIEFSAPRGVITDRHGYPLAVGLSYYKLKVISDKLDPTPKQLAKIAGVIKQPKSVIEKIIKKKRWGYVPGKLSYEQVLAIEALGAEGLEVEEVPGRYYPLANATSTLLGTIGVEGDGQLGLEFQFNDKLKGTKGQMHFSQNLLGQVHEVYENSPAVHGSNLRLTIDSRIQQLGHEVLKEAVAHHKAEAASAVILDVQTGDILAMLNYPGFDPNKPLARVDNKTKNLAITDLFEPGSIIKPLVMSAILSKQYYQPDDLIETESEGYMVGNAKITDHKYFGAIRFEDVLMKSSNIAMVKLTESLPRGYLLQHLNRFGLFMPTYVSLPGETAGQHQAGNNKVEQATMSYGYGMAVNLLAMAKAYNVIAGMGKDPGVSIIKNRIRPDPEFILKEKDCRYIASMMQRVTEKGLSSRNAAVKGVSVAGKSGTTHTLAPDGTYQDQYVASFAGFAPVEAPRIVIAVMVKHPTANGHYGGQVAAPIFAKLLRIALHYENSKEGVYVGDQGVLPNPLV